MRKKQLTSSVDDEIPGLTTNHDRGDVGNILVGDRARASSSLDAGGFAIDLLNAGLAFLNDVLD